MTTLSPPLAPVRIAAPDVVVTLAEFKRHLRLSHSDEDDYLGEVLLAATAHFDGYEGVLGRALAPQRWREAFPAFERRLRLATYPVRDVQAVTYRDVAGAAQSLPLSGVRIVTDHAGSALEFDDALPAVEPGRLDAVLVEIDVGEASAADVPAPVRQAIKLLAAHFYENREATTPAALSALPLGVSRLVAPYRRLRL